jgi:acyl-[acyl-carrier-protein]-phospholipid O-acyltransferase/long-chain-fatty-acid--[acyl-carrier-protein] ligase
MLNLIAARRFGPLFATQFLGAFNDNLYKTALLFLVAFHLKAGDPKGAAATATMAAALFSLPFLLFSGIAGEVCDSLDKARVARLVKLAEVAIMLAGAAALWFGSLPLGLAAIFLMGLHSTVFGPVKYAILPQHLAPAELLAGTGLVEGATFVAILLGQISGGLLGFAAGPVAIGVALAGVAAARFIPPAPPAADRRIDWNPLTSSRRALAGSFGKPHLAIATVAISWFWALGAVFTTQFVPLVKNDLAGSEGVATLFLAAFSIGIAAGSAGVGRLLRGRVTNRWTPWAGLVMAIAAADLYRGVHGFAGPAGNVSTFLASPDGWRLLADLAVMAVAGGVFSVPLYGVLQTESDAGHGARAIAANNIINALFQAAAVVAAGAAVSAGAGLPEALLGAALTVLLLLPLLRRLA